MVRRVWSVLLMLVAASLAMATAVHARELPGASLVECSGAAHVDGDADQSQGDADKAPHHHGTCHGQVLAIGSSEPVPVLLPLSGMRPLVAAERAARSSMVDPGLRPPAI